MATTWDTLLKAAGVTLSGGALIATIVSGTSGVGATRSLSGLTYFECAATARTGVVAAGLCTKGYTLGQLGADNTSLGYRQDGTVVLNAVTLTTIATYTQGDVIGVAIRPSDRLAFFRVNTGSWNNSGTANPVTGVGGIDFSSIAAGSLFPAVSAALTTPNAVWTAAFTTFANTAPTGFITVDTIAVAGINVGAQKAASFSYAVEGPALLSTVAAFSGGHSPMPTAVGAWYGNQTRVWTPAATGKTISGIVKELGVAVGGREVRLDEHATGYFLAKTTTAGDGSFSFTGLNPAILYSVVAYDPTTYDALVLDLVAPA